MSVPGSPASEAAGAACFGQVQGSTSPNYLPGSLQVPTLDTTGAQKSSNEGMKATYSAATAAYAPYANAADIVNISGSASKKVRVLRIAVSGRASAANQLDVTVTKRASANSGGSPTALIAVPHDSGDGAATAAVVAYSAAPTPGTPIGMIRAVQSNVSAAGSGGAATPVEFDFGWCNDKTLVLNGAAENLSVGLNGTVPAGTVLNVFIEWTEE